MPELYAGCLVKNEQKDMDNLLDDFKKATDAITAQLKKELLGIRTGRATPALLENIAITVYQGSTKLKLMELATITTQDSQTLVVAPFDPSTIKDIESGISQSDLGIQPIVQEQRILVKLPPLTEEQRKKYLKLVGQIVEEHREKIRQERDRIRKRIKTAFEEKELTEDQKFSLFKRLDEKTKEVNQAIQNLREKKEQELAQL